MASPTKKMRYKPFSVNLRKLRVSRGISQTDLAFALDSTQPVISSYEGGRCEPPLEMLVRIAAYFCVNVDLLLDEKSYELMEEKQ